MSVNNTAPCLNCPRRAAGCHATCEDYKQWKGQNDEFHKLVAAKREKDGVVYGYYRKKAERKERRYKNK